MCGAVASAWCVPSHACVVAFDRKIDAELVAEGTESQSRDHRDHRTGRTGNPIWAADPPIQPPGHSPRKGPGTFRNAGGPPPRGNHRSHSPATDRR